MSEIIERLEKATGPDRDLDDMIVTAALFEDELGEHEATPRYTASIDAAMTLVPEGWRMVGMSECERGGWYASAFPRDPDAMGIPRTFEAHSATLARGEAPTPALALCIAALKAREQSK